MRLNREDAEALAFCHTPNVWADLAEEAQAGQRWMEAADCWNRAYACTIGHNRRYRYGQAEQRCRDKAIVAALRSVRASA